jgi:hypothetical protein
MRFRAAIATSLAGAILYRRARPWILTWGASPSEVSAPMPGDDLLPAADGVSTRAISVDAPAADVWPWLAQMGPAPRGGAYTYDWIENLLGLNMHSVGQVLNCHRSGRGSACSRWSRARS